MPTYLRTCARWLIVRSENDFQLLVLRPLAALFPVGPFPVLALDGEQGSGKTTVAKMLRALIGPNMAGVQPLPRDERDLVIACTNSLMLALDNLSGISGDTADKLCRIATGTGFRERQLYTNGDEQIVSVQDPVLFNGIPALLARADLADRAIAVTLPAIADNQRRTDAAVWTDFEAARHPCPAA